MANSFGTARGSSAALLALALCAAPLLAQTPTEPVPETPTPAVAASPQTVSASSIRIVRLSQVIGDTKLDRGIDRGFEPAFNNLPITQGARLLTGEGAAEVEFEDNSSLRLTPHSEVEFPLLSLAADGTRISTVRVRQGNVYVSLVKNKENTFTVLFGKETVTLAPATHIALAITPQQRRLDVLDGSVQDTNDTTTTTVGKKKALLFGNTMNTAAPTLVSENAKGPYDAWDKQAVQYHSRFASSSHYASTPSYGTADLNYYGSFGSVGGCGNMWRPYMASANWSPYGNGSWAYYSTGYSYVSPYPWGWLPYHSGSWDYCPGTGWGWRPGNQWNGLQNTPAALTKTPANAPGPRQLKPPLAAPRPVGPSVVTVSHNPIVTSRFNERDGTFIFRNDSAGLGVPRGSFGKLGGISNGVVQHGTVERTLYAPQSGSANATQNPGLLDANRSLYNGRATATGGNAVSAPRSIGQGSPSYSGGRSISPSPSMGGYSGGGSRGSMSSGSMSGGGGMSAGGGMSRGSMSAGGAGGSSAGHH